VKNRVQEPWSMRQSRQPGAEASVGFGINLPGSCLLRRRQDRGDVCKQPVALRE
jgi:hypothetical protein